MMNTDNTTQPGAEVPGVSQDDEKIQALMAHLKIDADEAEQLIEDGDYLVLTDEEADQAAKENIEESLWAFNKSFLNAHSEAISEIPEKDFVAMQGKLCESFNKAVKAMIDDFEHFVEDAISCDGRGHFMNTYDDEENEEKINETYYYIYRIN
jgi:hypothetical protein